MRNEQRRTTGRGSAPDRRGGAILMVLAGAAVLAFATTGALAAVVEMRRQEVAERSILDAELAAEAALARRLATWDVREALGTVSEWLEDTQVPAGTEAHSHVQPVGPGLWRLHGVAERQDAAGNALARRSRTVLLRARPPLLPLEAPLTVAGTLEVGAGLAVNSDDESPPAWGCPVGAEPAGGAVALLPDAAVTGAVPAPAPTVDAHHSVSNTLLDVLGVGSPVVGTSSLEPTLVLDALMAPDARHAPAPSCELGARGTPLPPLGWGDPVRPSACQRYLPYVRVNGDLTAPTGSGQGVLLIDGDLTVTSAFTWAGLLVVRGRLSVVGSGFNVFGALVLLGDEHHELAGDTTIWWSSCSLRAAMIGAATVTPVTGTPWSSLR